jgi:cytochrome P450
VPTAIGGIVTTTHRDPPFDLRDPSLLFRDDVIADPRPLYRQLQAEAPVWELPGSATFLVTSAALVNEAVARVGDFSSNLTSLIHRGDDGCPQVFDMTPLGDATHVLATADPPVHTRHRKLLQPSLTPGCVAQLHDEIAAMVDDLLAPLLLAGRGDLVAALADPLPMRVIARVIGLPPGDPSRLVTLVLDVDQMLAGVSDPQGMARAAAAAGEQAELLAAHLQQAIDDRTSVLADTQLAVLAGAVERGEVTFEEAVGMLVQLLGAGSETTTSLLASAVRILANEPALQARLRADDALVPTFLEEVLRIESPFRFHYRAVPRTTELGGVAIPAGSRLLLMWGAANLDGAEYPHAERLDLERPFPKSHLAFGRGIHFCIGAPLARLEVTIATQHLLACTSAIALDPDVPPRYHRDIFLRRLAQLGVVLTAASG